MAKLSPIDLNSVLVFAAVAESGGFTAAAERLGVAKAKVSLEVGRLESRLGVRLFNRTTRRVVVTGAGRALYEDCVPPLRGVIDSLDRSRVAENSISGTMRICCTSEDAARSVAAAVAAFSALHPNLHLDLRSSDRVVDLVKDGIDVAFRGGWLRDSSLRAVKLGSFEQHLVASPRYLMQAGTPKLPRDLASHGWVALTLLSSPLTWTFVSQAGVRTRVRVKARLRTDSTTALRALLEAGAGISVVVDDASSQAAVMAGRLQRLLPEWNLRRGGVYAVFPPGKHIVPAAGAFVDFYKAFLVRGPRP